MENEEKRSKIRHRHQHDAIRLLDESAPPPGPTADSYRITGYVDGLIGAAKPECDLLLPHYDSGLKYPDKNNPQPTDVLWGGGVRAGLEWDGTFYRDLARYGQSGALFWSSYLKPGSGPGNKNGYWFNFGSGWCHLANDDPAQILTGASQRLYWDAPHPAALHPASPLGGEAASTASGEGCWNLVIEATMFVTYAVVNVWTGFKQGGPDPTGQYTRVTGCDPLPALSVEVV